MGAFWMLKLMARIGMLRSRPLPVPPGLAAPLLVPSSLSKDLRRGGIGGGVFGLRPPPPPPAALSDDAGVRAKLGASSVGDDGGLTLTDRNSGDGTDVAVPRAMGISAGDRGSGGKGGGEAVMVVPVGVGVDTL